VTRRGALGLAGTAAALLVLIAGEFWGIEAHLARIDVPAARSGLAPERAPEAGETAAPSESIDAWLATALARPLMSSTRRPAPSTGSGISLSNGLPRLAGTLFDSGGGTAIFARDDSGHPVVVRVGGALGPYHVTHIAPNSVTLDGPGGAQTLHPRFGDPKAAGIGPEYPNMPGPMNMPGVMQPMPGLLQHGFQQQQQQDNQQDAQPDSQ
jgi:hypothetical protein